MIIDGVEYPDTTKKKPKTIISIKNFNLMLRMFALMSLNINPAIARPLSSRITAHQNLNYQNTGDPSMPIPDYYSTIDPDWTIYHYPFVGYNFSNALVVSGDHTVAKQPKSSGHSHSAGIGQCFDFNKLVTVLDNSIGNVSATTVVKYNDSACEVHDDNDGVGYHAIVYGLTGSDCNFFRSNYYAQVDECHYRSAHEEMIQALIGTSIFMAIFIPIIILIVISRKRDTAQTSISSGVNGGGAILNAYPFSSDRGLINAISEEIKLSDTPGIDISLKQYLISIEKSDIRLKELNDEDRTELIKSNPDLCCPLSLELMDMPVLVGGNAFDFSSLLSLPASDGKRNHPLRSGQEYQFRLDQVQPAIEKRAAIKNLIEQKLKPASENTALLLRI